MNQIDTLLVQIGWCLRLETVSLSLVTLLETPSSETVLASTEVLGIDSSERVNVQDKLSKQRILSGLQPTKHASILPLRTSWPIFQFLVLFCLVKSLSCCLLCIEWEFEKC